MQNQQFEQQVSTSAGSSSGDAVIVTENVKKTYSDNGVPVEAVRGISLIINPGEFTAIVGPSGSGKSTFLNLISSLDTPTAGKVWLAGKALSEMSGKEMSDFRRDNLGFIFQAYNLIPVLTVEENVEYIMLLQGVSKEERHQRVMDILKMVGLDGYADRRPTQLSGGQQQRVAIARAMVSRPALILADEPTANLDSETGAGLLDMMRQLNRKTGMTFLFSTHDQMVMERALRLITLKDGQVESDHTRNDK
ncbi:MAG: ABC transporter ATP-binding protein [Calditrichia bacterium]